MSNAREHSQTPSRFFRDYPYWVAATTARIGELRSDQTAARFQSIPQFAASSITQAATPAPVGPSSPRGPAGATLSERRAGS